MPRAFYESCYNLLEKVPKGKVATYKAIAEALSSKAYRAVGSAMRHNPKPIEVPCHRVVNSDGRIGNYALGRDKKIALLREEGITIEEGRVVGLEEKLYTFKGDL